MNTVRNYIRSSKHMDGRKLTQYRPITVEYGITGSAEGSARVKIGNTEVIAGVKLSIEKPYPDTGDQGNIAVNTELLAMSSPEFEPGPPDIQSIELARVVDRGIRESHSLDTHKLCILKGEKVWSVFIDICTINDEGNLFDAASLAAIAALKNATFPGQNEEGKVDYEKKTDKKLPISKTPIEVTVCKIGDNLFIDPLPEEEKEIEARLTVAITEKGKLCALQKGGSAQLTIEEIDAMVAIALEKAPELRKHL